MDLRGFVLVSEQATKKLKTTTTDVTVGDSDVPTVGQVLTATSGSNAIWQTPSSGGITGVTASAAELNILDGATLSTTELNLLDGAAPFAPVPDKCVVYGTAGGILANDIFGTTIYSTASRTNEIDQTFTGTLAVGASVATGVTISRTGHVTEIRGSTRLFQTVTFGTGVSYWTIPSTDGLTGQVLTTNGLGTAAWTSLTEPAYEYLPLSHGLTSTPTGGTLQNRYFVVLHLPFQKTFSTISYFGLSALGNLRFALYSGTDTTATLIAQTASTPAALGYRTLPLVLVSGSMTFAKGSGILLAYSNDNVNEKIIGLTSTASDTSLAWQNSTSLVASGFGTNPAAAAGAVAQRPCLICH